MKRQIMVGAALVAVMAGGVYSEAALAAGRRGSEDKAAGDCQAPESGKRGRDFQAKMAKKLGLTAEQKVQVDKILAAERETVEPLLKKLGESRKSIREASEAVTFDEAAVRRLAAGETEVRTELIVSHARTRSKINALLTAEQREKAGKMLPPPLMRGDRPSQPPEGF